MGVASSWISSSCSHDPTRPSSTASRRGTPSNDVGLHHAGFKDVGVDIATLVELNKRMQAAGVTTYLEVVSTSAEGCLQSCRAAVEIGVNRLMGGTQVDEALRIIEGSGIDYLPFPGLPVGHPTRLGGDADLDRAALQGLRTDADAPASTCWPIGRPRQSRSIWFAPPAEAPRAIWSSPAVFRRRQQIADLRGSRSRRIHDWLSGVRRIVLTQQGQHRVAAA